MSCGAILVIYLFVELCAALHFPNEREIEAYLKETTKDFEKDPRNPRFCGIIIPPTSFSGQTQDQFLLPKVFLWSPQEQYGYQLFVQYTGRHCDHGSGITTSQGKKENGQGWFTIYSETFFLFRGYIFVSKVKCLIKYMPQLETY